MTWRAMSARPSPPAVTAALVALAGDCLAKFARRLPGLAPAMQQLKALADQYCRPTAEEVWPGDQSI